MEMDSKRPIIILMAGILIFGFCESLTWSTLVYSMMKLGATPVDAGTMAFFHAMMLAIFSLVWGFISDLVGRKPVILASIAGTGLFSILLSLGNSVEALYYLYILTGVLSAGILPVSYAFVASEAGSNVRAGKLSLLFAAGGAGILLGSTVFQYRILDNAIPLAGLIGVGTALLMVVLLPGTTKGDGTKTHVEQTTGRAPFIIWLTFITLLLTLGILVSFGMRLYNQISTYYVLEKLSTSAAVGVPLLWMHYSMDSISLIWLVLAISGISTILCQAFLVRPAIGRLGEAGTMLGGLIVAILGIVIFIASFDLVSLVVGACLFTVGVGIYVPCSYALMSGHAPERWIGMTMGALAVTFGLGPIAGLLIDLLHLENNLLVLVLTGSILAISACLTYVLVILQRKDVKNIALDADMAL